MIVSGITPNRDIRLNGKKKKTFNLKETIKIPLTHPLIFTLVPLMMHPLLQHSLVRRIVRIEIFDRLPPAGPTGPIARLEGEAAQQRRQREALRVHSRLHEFLRRRQVRVAADEGEGGAHGGDPRCDEERVAVLGDPEAGALRPGFGGDNFGGSGGGAVAVVVVAMPGGFETPGVAVGCDNGWCGVSFSFFFS